MIGLLAVALLSPLIPRPHELRVQVPGASLYTRVVGRGPAMIVLHGGPDFDSAYLLPDLDRLSDSYRLIYYDQRGRGKSAAGVRPDDVTLASELDDLDRVRRHFHLDKAVLLGHSWGTVLALEYARRYPERVSRLILMNPAPASAADVALLRKSYLEALGSDMDAQRAILDSAAYKEGDPEAVIARYRIHFEHAFKKRADNEKMMTAMHAAFIRQGKEGIVKARAVEDRLYLDTWKVPGYDLLPKLQSLDIPTLVIVGDSDFIPPVVASHIAAAIPNATLVTIEDCGHFSYLEKPAETRRAIDEFLRRSAQPPKRSHESALHR